MKYRYTVLLPIASVVLGACREQVGPPTAPSFDQAQVDVTDPGDAMRAEYRSTSDAALLDLIAEGGRIVTIGLKTPTATRGVGPEGQVLVDERTRDSARSAVGSTPGVALLRSFPDFPVVIALVDTAAVLRLRADPRIDYIAPNWPPAAFDDPVDEDALAGCPWNPQQIGWHLIKTRAVEAWVWTKGQIPPPWYKTIAILDDGIDQGSPHPTEGFDTPDDSYVIYRVGDIEGWHGTRVASIAAALDTSVGALGAAPLARLSVYAIGEKNYGSSNDSIFPADVMAAIVDHASQHYVMNMSFSLGTLSTSGPFGWNGVHDVIAWAYSVYDVVFVGSAGNQQQGNYRYPARWSEVIGVGGTDSLDNFAWGDPSPGNIELVAPSTWILHNCLEGGGPAYDGGGTSWATPQVAAAAHLIKTMHLAWPPDSVRHRLRTTTKRLGSGWPNNTYGWGRIDLLAAVKPNTKPPTFSVSIEGTSPIRPQDECTWVASVVAGTGPHAYAWYRNGQWVSNQSEYSGSMDSTSSFTLTVWVTDATNAMVTDDVTITSSPSAPPCLM